MLWPVDQCVGGIGWLYTQHDRQRNHYRQNRRFIGPDQHYPERHPDPDLRHQRRGNRDSDFIMRVESVVGCYDTEKTQPGQYSYRA